MERLTPETLRQSWSTYGSPRARWRVGGEFERAAVRGDGSPVTYEDPDGIRWILEEAGKRIGWKLKYEGENPVEAQSGYGAALTLEPGGQVELSGAPYTRLSDLAEEVWSNRRFLLAVAEGRDMQWISCGLTPFATIADIPFVPKGRYNVMRKYLPQQGTLAHWMMKGTCAVQANFDYADEADCAAKFHVSMDLAPLSVALFANSPLAEGKETGYQSFRAHVWTETDAARTGFPPTVRDGYRHDAWVEYLLDCPMMFYLREGSWAHAGGVTFRQWMGAGIDGLFPTMADWELHQTAVFTEVRVKKWIELRSADAVDAASGIAFCALWTGLLYGAIGEARTLADEWMKGGIHQERHREAARHGLKGSYGGRLGGAWAKDLVAIARKGLLQIGEDATLLAPLEERAESGRSPAEDILDAFRRDPSPGSVLPVVAY